MKTTFVVLFIAVACVFVAGVINGFVGGYDSEAYDFHDEWEKGVCKTINDVLATIAYSLLTVICILAIIYAVRR